MGIIFQIINTLYNSHPKNNKSCLDLSKFYLPCLDLNSIYAALPAIVMKRNYYEHLFHFIPSLACALQAKSNLICQ